ncbi:Anaphase-promoting complex subunit 1 [Trapelia coarctata]|nr:Anaphase-promoting complex subunit 1 [Trapelia coarctata]
MASVKSLGIHKPSALSYLVAEGILPFGAQEDSYTWQTVPHDRSSENGEEEELLTTRTCVVWSRAGIIRRIFRFDVELEDVVQAVLTRFPKGLEKGHHDLPMGGPSTRTASGVTGKGPGRSQSSAQAGKGAPRPGKSEQRSHNDISDAQGSSADSECALVVILKTQAHVFFLSGTSHVVHLPFEVSTAFALQRGVLLQRKVTEKNVIPPIQPTPLMPSAPLNSFAFSNPNSSSFGPSSQPLQNLINGQNDGNDPKPFDSLFKKILSQSNKDKDLDSPRHFCLTDPLTEMGLVVCSTTPQSLHPKGRRKSTFESVLDASEDVVYISRVDELGSDDSINAERPPLMLALTQNKESQLITLWTVSFPKSKFQESINKHSTSTNGARSRRRSSYGPGAGTGATTPAVRNSLGPAESFAGPVDTTFNRSLDEDDTTLAAQLDPAFENPGLPAKASRRVSSLLARSDLSANHDRTMFPDLTAGHVTTAGTKRGPSLGSHPLRSSFGGGLHVRKSRRSAAGSQSGHDGDNLSYISSQTTQENDSEDDLSSLVDLEIRNDVRGLRKEMAFTKVHSFHSADQQARSLKGATDSAERMQVFTLNPPKSQAGSSESPLVMCIVDPQNRRLSTLQAHALMSSPLKKKPRFNSDSPEGYTVKVTQIRTGDGVLGACKVSDGTCSRLLVLSAIRDGMTELTLQTPWSALKRIQLPASLLINNPYRVSGSESSQHKRKGGLKRVLSEGAEALISIEHSTGLNDVDIRDSKGIRHRIEIQMEPSNLLVKSALKICESVLPREDTELEPILRAWWDVMSWLQPRREEVNDLEWTAFIVCVFSMFVVSIDEPRAQSALRQKKQKGGLLRSSSGGSVDLDCWNKMIIIEGDCCGSSPTWLHDPAWAWTQESDQLTGSPFNFPTSSPKQSRMPGPSSEVQSTMSPKSTFLSDCATMAREFAKSADGQQALGKKGYLPTALSKPSGVRRAALPTILIGLHLFREELKLNVLTSNEVYTLTPILAQLGGWLDWESWSCRGNSVYLLESDSVDHWVFEDSVISDPGRFRQVMEPPSILRYIEEARMGLSNTAFTTLQDICHDNSQTDSKPAAYKSPLVRHHTPRTSLILQLLETQHPTPTEFIALISASGVNRSILDSLPEGVAAPLRASIAICQADPVSTWTSSVLELLERDDVSTLENLDELGKPQVKITNPVLPDVRDVHAICSSTLEADPASAFDGSGEIDRQWVTRKIFKDDQRWLEALKLVHPLKPAVTRCIPEPEWSDTDLLEAQQELVKHIVTRTLSVSPGRGMLFFSARYPLLTEKLPIHGFTMSCVMKPANTTVTADRNNYAEEKVYWAFFHAGVEAGLSICKDAKGIDTSWILFNKPAELGNRHAGFLLALGLNGHLKSIAKWVAFKYLTPKHTMTSIGLLLGLAASYLGTMDTLITRLLSVHVTRMLPVGAAELNLAPLTQTTGIMAIGLLYANTQHRRMSEIMLSEMENTDQDENASPMDNLRDEGYRLAAGFALGYINIGQGKDLKGLHDMHIVERLLALAVGTKKVDLVHILDKATAGAVIAITLIFMKTHDEALSKKIDIPDTIHQFEYVRPDIFLLRTVARHLIMWDHISASFAWMRKHLPSVYQPRVKLTGIRSLTTDDLPLLNIVAGLCFSIGLRFAGSAQREVRDLLGHYLDQFIRICRLPVLNYDGKLTRITARNCQDVVALSAASVMAGTGDIFLLRRLRSLHSRSDPDTPYGSHLAAHMAIGVLFLAGGTHSLSTSNIAIASLLCAFYPLFPTSFLDNKSHLQAFRHFWVLAAEPRCLVVREADTHRPLSQSIVITLRSGEELAATAPCLLPELDSIAKIQTNDPEYWRITLDFVGNAAHLPFFRKHQSVFVRRRGAYDAHTSVFSATLQALNDVQFSQQQYQHVRQVFQWIFTLDAFRDFDRAERTLVLPPEFTNSMVGKTRSTVADDRLVLETALASGRSERLWSLRLLFAWADGMRKKGAELGWLGGEVVEGLRARVGVAGRE